MNDSPNLQVVVLFAGYSHCTETSQRANCTCTLIKGPPHIIVDTMTAWDGPKLLQALKTQQIAPETVDYVVCTHGHSDHIGCNYLFPNAKHIVGFSISHKDLYYEHDFLAEDYVISGSSDKIRVMATPGHTMQDVTVVLETSEGIIAITGDLFENESDLNDESVWINAGSDCVESQRKNRRKILDIADYIVPGHGPMFKVNKQ